MSLCYMLRRSVNNLRPAPTSDIDRSSLTQEIPRFRVSHYFYINTQNEEDGHTTA